MRWAKEGETFCVSSIVWYEFLCGPISNEQETAMNNLMTEIIPFDEAVGKTAANLFNQVGRSRQLRVDAMIAATAIFKNRPLATNNTADFARFTPFGLQLEVCCPPVA